MTCPNKKYMSLMNKVLDGEATKEEQDELYEHMASCDSCRSHFKELKQSTEMLNQLMHPHLPIDFTKNVLEQLPADKRHVIRKWTVRHPVIAAVAICALPMSLMVIAAGRQNTVQEKGSDGFILVKAPANSPELRAECLKSN